MPDKFNSESAPQQEEASQKFAEEKISKIKYWDEFAKKHIPEMRLLFRGGKLWEKEGWRKVVEHSLPAAAATEILSDMLELPEKEELIRTAICHDWDKHLEKKPDDFSEEDRKKALSFLEKIELNSFILSATKTDFPERVLDIYKRGEDVPVQQLLMFYIDAITAGGDTSGKIVPFEERLNEVRPRYPHLPENYWKNVRTALNLAQDKIYGLLKEKGIKIEKAEDVPALITNSIEAKYGANKN